MIAGKLNGNHGRNSLALVNKVTESRKKTRDALRLLDKALAANKSRKMFKAIRKTVKICERTSPELVDKLKHKKLFYVQFVHKFKRRNRVLFCFFR